jgi:hypothetical protein
MGLIRTSILLSVLIAIPCAQAFELIPHNATYSANIKKGIKISGKAVRELKQLDDQSWLYSFNVSSFAADIDESVVFTLREGGIESQKYRYKLSPVLGKSKRASADFDWTKQLVNGSNRGKAWTIADIPLNTYDRLGYQLQLLRDINLAKATPAYKIAHKAKLRPTQFERIGKELVDTKLGSAATIIVRKVRDAESKRETHLWISEKYPMLLVKMTQIEKDGEQYEIHLESANVQGTPISFDTQKIDNQS